MEAKTVRDLDDLAFGNTELRSRFVVRRIAKRDDGIQSVVATRQFDDDEDAIRVLLEARTFERLGRERGGRAIQEEGQSRAESETVHASNNEVPAVTAATGMFCHRDLSPPQRLRRHTEAQRHREIDFSFVSWCLCVS